VRLRRADAGVKPSQELRRRRLTGDEIASGRIEVRVTRGRVELGASPDGAARMRWMMLRGAPRLRARRGRLRIAARRARLILELPPELRVEVRLRHGEITSWGARGELDLVAKPGRVICRELACPAARVRGQRVSLHFAAPPQQVDVVAQQATVTLPSGPYTITAPASAEVTIPRAASPDAAVGTVVVRAADARLLAAQAPIPLAEADNEAEPGSSRG
jgi:hypothetical protein